MKKLIIKNTLLLAITLLFFANQNYVLASSEKQKTDANFTFYDVNKKDQQSQIENQQNLQETSNQTNQINQTKNHDDLTFLEKQNLSEIKNLVKKQSTTNKKKKNSSQNKLNYKAKYKLLKQKSHNIFNKVFNKSKKILVLPKPEPKNYSSPLRKKQTSYPFSKYQRKSQAVNTVTNVALVNKNNKNVQLNEKKSKALLNSVNELLKRGYANQAEEVLEKLDVKSKNIEIINEVTFLKGMVAQKQGKFYDAEKSFRKILNKNPNLTRVRLELARVLFDQNKSVASTRHFKMALASDLPPIAKNKIQNYLSKIEHRRWWHFSTQASLQPDSNVNYGSGDSTVNIWGIPFSLDNSSQEKSGLGIVGSVSLVIAPKISKNIKWRSNFYSNYTHYADNKYSTSSLTAETGPVFYFNNSSLGIYASSNKRQLGNKPYSTYQGVRTEYRSYFAGIYLGGGSLSYSKSNFNNQANRNGYSYGINFYLGRPLNKRTYFTTGLSSIFEKTKTDFLDNNTYQLYTTLTSELIGGINIRIKPQLLFREFLSTNPTFNKIRKDNSYGVDISLVKRDWIFKGFVPEISYSYLQNNSNISIYDFERHRANFGITRDF